jgi:DNA polymerase-3 subunit delta
MIYLLYGSDEYNRTEALKQIKAQIPADLLDLNLANLDGRKLKLDALIAACEAFPFLAEQRLVIVSDLLKYQKAGKERDETKNYLSRVPNTCDLVFVENEEFDKRNAIFTQLKKVADVREFLPKEGNELLRWVHDQAKLLKVKLDPAAAQRLISYVGNDSRTLINELGKLASYVGTGNIISLDAVELMVNDGQEQNLFAFIDELSARRRGPALQGLKRLFADRQAATYILFMIARQVRILIGVKSLATQRIKPDEIASRLGQRPFVIKKALEQVRGFQEHELTQLHDRILELDHASKTGRIEAETGLEILVIELCR